MSNIFQVASESIGLVQYFSDTTKVWNTVKPGQLELQGDHQKVWVMKSLIYELCSPFALAM